MAAVIGAWAIGIALYAWIWPWGIGILILCALVIRTSQLKRLWLLGLVLLVGSGWAGLRVPRPSAADISQAVPCRACTVIGRLQGVPRKEPGQARFVLQVEQLGDKSATGLLQVTYTGAYPADLGSGDRLRLQGMLRSPNQAMNPNEFDYRTWLAGRGIFAVLSSRSLERLAARQDPIPVQMLANLRSAVATRLQAAMPVVSADFLLSLVFGAGAAPVERSLQDDFQAVGLQHVLAVSGFQVQLLIASLLGLARWARLGRVPGILLSACLLWVYIALTGFPPSVLRAGTVASLGLLALLRWRSLDPRQGLLAGGGLLLLIQPHMLFDLGFQFSFLATFGLLTSAEGWARRLGFLPLPLAVTLGSLLAAQLWVMPIQLLHFGSFSWLLLPANLWAALWVPLLSYGALLATLLTPLPLVLGALGGLLHLCVQAFVAGVHGLATLPVGLEYVPHFGPVMVGLAYMALFASLSAQRVARRILLTSLVALPLWGWSTLSAQEGSCPVRVTFFYIGQGDATLIEAHGQTLLIDAGPRSERNGQVYDAGERVILPYLRRNRIGHIDRAVISHAHLDHYGGFQGLLDAGFPIRELHIVNAPYEGETYRHLLHQFHRAGTRIRPLQMGQSEAWAGLELETIGPVRIHDHAEHETVNNHSVVLRLTHDQVRILLPGDAEAEAEQDLLAHPEVLQAEIIKVPHHGSDSSSTPALLAAVRPRDAIASAGIGNRYGHPAAEVASRYQAAGATFWRTDQQGAVCVCSQGTGYRITAHHSRP